MKKNRQIIFLMLILGYYFVSCMHGEKNGKNSLSNSDSIITVDTTQPEVDSSLISAAEVILDRDSFLTYEADPQKQELKFYLKDDKNIAFGSIMNLKDYLESKNKTLVFAMNGGMYMPGNIPLGLYIENGRTIKPINKKSAPGANFYSKPNGIFYIDTNNLAAICKTEDFIASGKIKYATQSGPMLLIDGEMHPVCKPGSLSLNIRNGVGILPDNHVLFVLSSKEVSFYDLANYFKIRGCKNALFLDGAISRAYLPEKNWTDLDGDFGPIIAVTK